MVSTACIGPTLFRIACMLSSPGVPVDGVDHSGSLEVNVL